LLGRRPEALQRIAQRPVGGAQKWIYPVDLGVADEIAALAAGLRRDGAAVDILVHSAGTISLGNFENAPIEEFDRQVGVNLKAPFLLTQALLPQLGARRGQVVFINSSAGVCGAAGAAPYSASKHGLKGLADSL